MFLHRWHLLALFLVACSVLATGPAAALPALMEVTSATAGEKKPVMPDLAAKLNKAKPVMERTIAESDVVRRVAFTPDGVHLASVCFDGTVKVWESANGKFVRAWEFGHLVSALAVSPDGKKLAAGNSAGELLSADIGTGKVLISKTLNQNNIYHVAFAPSGRSVALANHTGTVTILDADTGKVQQSINAHEGRVWWVAYHPNGKILASAGEDRLVRLWDVATGKQMKKLKGHVSQAATVEFSPGGKLLASGGLDGAVVFWDHASGKKLHSFVKGEVHALAFSDDGSVLASTEGGGAIHLWEASTGKLIHTLNGGGNRNYSVTFTKAGNRLAAAGVEGTIRIWQLFGKTE